MMEYKNRNLVMNKPEIFLNIKFGLDWISDIEARKVLKNHFFLQECAYPDVDLMEFMLQERADTSRDYLNRLYELKLANKEYNPIENFDRYEDYTDSGNANSKVNSNNSGKQWEFPMNTTSKKQTGEQESTGNSNSDSTSKLVHSGHLHGNIGVTTGAQMIQGEVDIAQIIYKLKIQLCKEFDDLFMITI